jgi:hypothetical protein
MASFSIHLAIGKRFIGKNNLIKDEKEFYKGIIAPDLSLNKNESHYTKFTDKSNLELYLSKRIGLYDYINTTNIDNDYEYGVFLHLITDYIFFTSFFDKEYIKNTNINNFNNDLYHSYDNTDKYVNTKYNIDYTYIKKDIEEAISRARKNKNTTYSNGNDIIPFDKLDTFIEDVSNINLEEYKLKILNKHII